MTFASGGAAAVEVCWRWSAWAARARQPSSNVSCACCPAGCRQTPTRLKEALDRWQPLHDPEPERPDQNFQLDGQQYNYRAAETHRILTELAGGVLTNYPLAKAPAPTEAQPHHAPTKSKRFAVALSFPSEHRDYVQQIADTLVTSLTKPRVFYDRYYEAELSRPNLDTYLQKIYHDESELVVVVICQEYDEKEWCGLEFRAIRNLIKKRRDHEIMFVRVADGDVKGVFGIDGYVDAKNRPATEIAQVICDRLALLQSQTP
ncbi:MAG: TIR domain-containing protein [Acidobacteriota bacterium]|nr:TIR domain-containing protein [Acidobacteriota bacterium]